MLTLNLFKDTLSLYSKVKTWFSAFMELQRDFSHSKMCLTDAQKSVQTCFSSNDYTLPAACNNATPARRPLLYLHGWNLKVGLPVEAVGHLEGGGAVHLPHAFQGNHVQLELGDEIETW